MGDGGDDEGRAGDDVANWPLFCTTLGFVRLLSRPWPFEFWLMAVGTVGPAREMLRYQNKTE